MDVIYQIFNKKTRTFGEKMWMIFDPLRAAVRRGCRSATSRLETRDTCPESVADA